MIISPDFSSFLFNQTSPDDLQRFQNYPPAFIYIIYLFITVCQFLKAFKSIAHFGSLEAAQRKVV